MYIHTHIHIHMIIYIERDIYMYIHICRERETYIYIYIYTCTCIYIYIYIHTCIHIHLYIYIYTLDCDARLVADSEKRARSSPDERIRVRRLEGARKSLSKILALGPLARPRRESQRGVVELGRASHDAQTITDRCGHFPT